MCVPWSVKGADIEPRDSGISIDSRIENQIDNKELNSKENSQDDLCDEEQSRLDNDDADAVNRDSQVSEKGGAKEEPNIISEETETEEVLSSEVEKMDLLRKMDKYFIIRQGSL